MENLLALPNGTELAGDYRIERVLGAGGYGITYLAREVPLARKVAIKEYFPSEYAAREDSSIVRYKSDSYQEDYESGLERFIDEARTLARFEHPNIVRVFRYFRANNTAYMVLQCEQGRSFKAWLDELGRPPSQGELDAMLRPLLAALEFIHKHDFLHRDIAPDNIIVRSDGTPVLIDFGSARGEIARHSRTVSAIVKPGYSPFEQYTAKGAQQGPWSDIYSLAATLYQAITGTRPLDSPTRISADEMVPAVSAARGDYRTGFLNAVDHALAIDPNARPRSVQDWRKALFGTAAGRHAANIRGGAVPDRQTPANQPAGEGAAPNLTAEAPPRRQQPTPTRKINAEGQPQLAWRRRERAEPEPGPTARDAARTAQDRAAAASTGTRPIHRAGRRAAEALADGGGVLLARGRDLMGRLAEAVPRTMPTLPRPDRMVRGWARQPDLANGSANGHANGNKPEQRKPRTVDIARLDTPAPESDEKSRAAERNAAAKREADAARAKIAREKAAREKAEREKLKREQAERARAERKQVLEEKKKEQAQARKKANAERLGLKRQKAEDARKRRAARRAAARERRKQRPRRSSWAWAALGARFALRAGMAIALVSAIVYAHHWLPQLRAGLPEASRVNIAENAPRFGLIRTLRGHRAPVRALAISRDGSRVVSSSGDGRTIVWDTATGEAVRSLADTSGSINALDLSGDRMIMARTDGSLVLRELTSGNEIESFKRHTAAVLAATFAERNTLFFSGSEDNDVRIWDIRRGTRRRLNGHSGPVNAVAYAPERNFLVTGGADDAVKLWNARRRKVVRTIHAHAGDVTAVAITPDGRTVASGGVDKMVKIWNTDSPGEIRTLEGHSGAITSLTFSRNGEFVASASEDQTIKLWRTSNGELLHTYQGHTGAVRAVAFFNDAHQIASAGEDHSVRLWNADANAATRQ